MSTSETENLKILLHDRSYNEIYENLNAATRKDIVTKKLEFHNYDLTSLEFAVVKGDWQMALLFYICGQADPEDNCWDGWVETERARVGLEDTFVHPAYRDKGKWIEDEDDEGVDECWVCDPIPGFEGLRHLLGVEQTSDEDRDAMECCLWLMEIHYNRMKGIEDVNLMAQRKFYKVKNAILKINARSVWQDLFKTPVHHNTLLVHRLLASKGGTCPPSDIVLHISDFAMCYNEMLHSVICQSFENAVRHLIGTERWDMDKQMELDLEDDIARLLCC